MYTIIILLRKKLNILLKEFAQTRERRIRYALQREFLECVWEIFFDKTKNSILIKHFCID